VYDVKDSLSVIVQNEESSIFDSMLSVLRYGIDAMNKIRRLEERLMAEMHSEQFEPMRYSLENVSLLAPVPRPNSLRDFLVFEEHLINSTQAYLKGKFPSIAWLNDVAKRFRGKPLILPPKAWYEIPIYYKGNADSVVGPDEPIIYPGYSTELDYELEFGVYLWNSGKDIAKSDASRHIAGYTIFNDFSARDIQFKEMTGRLGPSKGKDFDTGNVMGPFLVTPDEVGDPYALDMRAYVNDELWSSGNSCRMHFSFEEMIAYVSRSETLHPGDFFGSGTVGTGCGLELGRRLKRGDKVTLEVEKLGRLSNPIAI
jgi:2-keto-4-pentenoate hydratase/2-oxohepta-3-ene-1,7-dioic acid hydratase in catechol pathway